MVINKRPNGFIYPFTVMLILLFLMTALHLAQMLIIEKKYYEDTKNFYLLQHLISTGASQSFKKAVTGEEGELIMEDTAGTIRFSIARASADRRTVDLEFRLKKEPVFHASYDLNIRTIQISNWNEW
ncbi:hypothetical protein CEF21_15505 [Bacillus sp. FJAT-42376]|uniref:competence type IV pilus minor pilin ComGG n=1 Tax=Bacillus sp. FJAT-42376 TaxID=2014076 RepID=UPI000F517484|nr:competence type IV pilus minor pilin ComGG [Bacillus sp. FJAT-42376]AZB43599.1 hypothetical protein CEF21_15505 [Bacillus sp. FJAT-42376]